MVGTPPRPSQLGHGVYLRSTPVSGKKRLSLGWSPPDPGTRRGLHIICYVSIFCVKRERS